MTIARNTGAAALLAVAALFLTGCGGSPMPTSTSDDELFTRAQAVNAAFKSSVAEVQRELWVDEWRVGAYGDMPAACGSDEFRFEMSRDLPVADGWRFPSEPGAMRDDLAGWMESNGYTDITGLSYTDDVDTLTLTARNVDAGIDEITVQFHPGEVQDGISLSAASVCEAGDVDALAEAIYPGLYEDSSREWPLPETERPDATPIFGFTEDGQPR